ncbi:MAG: CARDB domain-containing protein [Candidatus Buchananbacteria bacterium]
MSEEIIKVESKPVEKKSRPVARIAIGTLNIFLVPAKKRFHRFYHPQKNNNWLWHIIVDGLLALAIILTTVFNVYIWLNPPQYTNDISSLLTANFYQPKLAVVLKTGNSIVNPGDQLTYRVKIKNVGRAAAQDIAINLYIDSELYSGGKKLIFTSEQAPALAELKPNAEQEVTYTFTLNKNFVQQTADQTQPVIASYAEVLFRSGNDLKERDIVSDKSIQKIRSDIGLEAFSRYQSAEGEQLGIGLNPPVVGSATRYWIFFAAATNYNDAENLTVTGHLPDNVRFTGRSSALSEEGISYNPNNRMIIWQLDRVAAPTDFYPVVGASLEVEITPWPNQAGQTGILIDNIKLTATDSFTGEKVEKIIIDVTTATAENPDDGKIKSK